MSEEIIINEVNVAECKHYKNQTCIADYLLTEQSFSAAKCANSPNCYFKQLQREKQNTKDLEEKLETICNLFEIEERKDLKEGYISYKYNAQKVRIERLKENFDELNNLYKMANDLLANRPKKKAILKQLENANKYAQALKEIGIVAERIRDKATQLDENNWGILDWKIIDETKDIMQKISEVKNARANNNV